MLFCHSNLVKKNGKRYGKQRYKCQSCSTYFDCGISLNNNDMVAISQRMNEPLILKWVNHVTLISGYETRI